MRETAVVASKGAQKSVFLEILQVSGWTVLDNYDV